jgi:hypothetical protein
MKVLVKPAAVRSINKLVEYITAEIQMPETGMRYGEKMIDFAITLGENWKAYNNCNYSPWNKLGLKCAVFDKKYVFAFNTIKDNVVIYYVRHGNTLA